MEDDAEDKYKPHLSDEIAAAPFCTQQSMLYKNISLYHKQIARALAIGSLKITFTFLLDINSDF